MAEPLALRFRPRTFRDVTGQQSVRVVLTQMAKTGKIPPALLFHGSWGSGKTSCARIFAAALNCEKDDPAARPCGGCATCVDTADGRSSDVLEIDAASAGGVTDMRTLRESVRFASVGRYRVVILDEAHNLSRMGFEALLKILEEPPENVVFILITTSLSDIPETIASRCFSQEFRRLTEEQIAKRISHIASVEGFELSAGLAASIAARSQGALRDAVMMLDECMLVGVSTAEQLAVLKGDTDVAVEFVTVLAKGNHAEAYAVGRRGLKALSSPSDFVSGVVSTLRRVLALSTLPEGATSPLAPPATAAEQALAATLAPARLVVAIRTVWEFYARIAAVADAYMSMDLLAVMLAEALTGGSVKQGYPAPDGGSSESSTPNTPVRAPHLTAGDILASAASYFDEKETT